MTFDLLNLDELSGTCQNGVIGHEDIKDPLENVESLYLK